MQIFTFCTVYDGNLHVPARAKRPYFYFRTKISRHHCVRRPRFPIICRNFGDSAINMCEIACISLPMRKTVLFLLPVKNLTSPSCSPTPISYNTREFWRYVNILGRYCVFNICIDFQDLRVRNCGRPPSWIRFPHAREHPRCHIGAPKKPWKCCPNRLNSFWDIAISAFWSFGWGCLLYTSPSPRD